MSQKILIIDDDLVALQLIQTGLGVIGYKVITAQNGEIGLQKFEVDPDHPCYILTEHGFGYRFINS